MLSSNSFINNINNNNDDNDNDKIGFDDNDKIGFDDNDLKQIFSKEKILKNNLIKELEIHNSFNDLCILNNDTFDNKFNLTNNPESFRNFYFVQTKKLLYNNKLFGFVHVRLSLFVKKKTRYNDYMKMIKHKINNAINITNKNNPNSTLINKFFVYLDLENIAIKNFSKKFLKMISKELNDSYYDQMFICYISGKKAIVRMFWPIISFLIDNKTKKKLVFLQ